MQALFGADKIYLNRGRTISRALSEQARLAANSQLPVENRIFPAPASTPRVTFGASATAPLTVQVASIRLQVIVNAFGAAHLNSPLRRWHRD
jgi:hypothetical protein